MGGIVREALNAWLAAADEQLEIYVDDAHHTYLDLYLGRADALDATGAAPRLVIEAAWKASRCYADHAPMYLQRWPLHRLRSRRILPLELALVGGDRRVIPAVGDVVGLDAMVLLARAEPPALTREIERLTGWFPRRHAADAADLVGMLAVMYACALSALLAGDAERFRATVHTAWGEAVTRPDLTEGASGGLARMLAVTDALSAALAGDLDRFGAATARHAELHRAAWLARDDDDAARGAGHLDTTALALIVAAGALGRDGQAALAGQTEPEATRLRAYAEVLVGADPDDG